ncbi:MAG TPA: VCBS repeat-containing protein, partial [Thermoanaerobaculia bacterium]
MKRIAMSLSLLLLVTVPALAELTPGAVVRSGSPFPVVADFNADGRDDLIQERGILVSNGDAPLVEVALALPSDERVIGALDVNADRVLDLITERSTPSAPASLLPQQMPAASSYRLRIGDAQRRYDQAINISSGVRPFAADADGDGKDDLVLMVDVRPDGRIATATDVIVMRSRGDGRFEQLPAVRIGKHVQLVPDHRVSSADLDRDGKVDLIIRTVEELAVLRGTGGGHFVVETRYMPWNEYGGWGLRVADVDGDANADLVVAGLQRVRVLFGDGRGNFPRAASAHLAKHRSATFPPGVLVGIDAERISQPRNLAVGKFTRTDRDEIAAGTLDGDLVVFAYENGSLKEVSRTETEFWLLDVRAGAFRNASGTMDLYAGGTLIWGDVWPRPRLFYSDAVAAAPLRTASRRRTASVAAPTRASLDIRVNGDCIGTTAGRWELAREGVFGVARNGNTTIETLTDETSLHFRLTV